MPPAGVQTRTSDRDQYRERTAAGLLALSDGGSLEGDTGTMMGPMIKLYSRHLSRCRHRDDRHHLQCDCPKWVQGRIRGQQLRRSTKENHERLAWHVVNDWMENGLPEDEKSQDEISLAQAGDEFIASCKAKGNKESTLVYQRKLVQDPNRGTKRPAIPTSSDGWACRR